MSSTSLRIASFNVENLFSRPRAMGSAPDDDGRDILEAHAQLGELIAQDTYTDDDKKLILDLLVALDLDRSDTTTYAVLRQVHGRLVKRSKAAVSVVADGRGDWVGWVELTKERIDALAMTHTAQVLREVDADIAAVVEVEGRIALERFAEAAIVDQDRNPLFPHAMVIDGNDDRGIAVGILSKNAYPLRGIRSHVDDRTPTGRPVFSRDCPEFTFDFPGASTLAGSSLTVLVNHFQSKGYGTPADSNARRLRQAERVAAIYWQLRADGAEFVAVVGDLNDTPDSASLEPLLVGTDLRDVSEVAGFDDGGRPGTYANGTASNKIDYVLLSPALFDRATGGAIFRKGVWGGKHGTLFEHFPTMTAPVHASSGHAAIYADIDLS
ncbi:endonuclease/exonuclease/phosphatase family protein [Rhodococcus koreensis]|uniref:Metal-dependent hydrolase, endonuclease/exonuclease/phosphatase family n=1 Tax=Rhodococcus koreensis TaxID=99653 RepID=A0A1H4V7V5_9NOCA|nr:endonuclease/exonuclease/phosphatase family protein [Rhodococcus koreensis]SEC77067.1 Metal-dependent hydrolase, endonuclease/exonuclease/phosphatase family [Rhodococcus koreensis]